MAADDGLSKRLGAAALGRAGWIVALPALILWLLVQYVKFWQRLKDRKERSENSDRDGTY